MGITSYAQNFEDVLLWRALGHIENGIYIDVGAQDPTIDSVSRAFYERGWRGIHVEPVSEYAKKLRRDRPDEVVVQAGLGNDRRRIPFFEIPDTGLSTASEEVCSLHLANGYSVVKTEIQLLRLDDILENINGPDIHWLKIDVEGLELEVLQGWTSVHHRPWIVVIESTLPNSQVQTYDRWEHLLLAKDYKFVYGDGLNRFYIANEQPHLLDAFKYSPNVFDGFQLSPTVWSVRNAIHGATERAGELEAQIFDLQEVLKNERAQFEEGAPHNNESLEFRLTDHFSRAATNFEATLTSAIASLSTKEAELAAALETMSARLLDQQGTSQGREQRLTGQISELTHRLEAAATLASERLDVIVGLAENLNASQAHGLHELQEALTRQFESTEENTKRKIDSLEVARENLIHQGLRNTAILEKLDRKIVEREEEFRRDLEGARLQIVEQIKLSDRAAEEAQRASIQNGLERDALATEIETSKLEVARLAALTTKQEASIEDLMRDSSSRRIELNACNERNDALVSLVTKHRAIIQVLRSRNDELVSSFSWRLTKPARTLAGLLTKASVGGAGTVELRVLDDASIQSLLDERTRAGESIPETPLLTQNIALNAAPQAELTNGREISTLLGGVSKADANQSVNTLQELCEYSGLAFVHAAYQSILGRDPDHVGLAYYMRRLGSGFSKEELIAQIASSPEARTARSSLIGLPEFVKSQKARNRTLKGYFQKVIDSVRVINRVEYKIDGLSSAVAVLTQGDNAAHRDLAFQGRTSGEFNGPSANCSGDNTDTPDGFALAEGAARSKGIFDLALDGWPDEVDSESTPLEAIGMHTIRCNQE